MGFELGIAPIIKGWSLGLETMKQGGKRSLIIPPTLGYGDVEVSSAGRPSIPPNSELRFELELVTVNNDIIRKMRRSLNDFLRPQGSDFVSPEEKQAIMRARSRSRSSSSCSRRRTSRLG